MKYKAWLHRVVLLGMFWTPMASSAMDFKAFNDLEQAYVAASAAERNTLARRMYAQIIDSINGSPPQRRETIGALLQYLVQKYDANVDGNHFQKFADVDKKVLGPTGLQTFLHAAANGQNTVDYAKCGPIHELAQTIIKDADPRLGAVLFLVGQENRVSSASMGHIILAVKDGNHYTVYNYNKTYAQFSANNIVELQKMVAKYADNLGAAGVVQLYGAEGGSYREYALGDETIYGDLIDKNARMLDTAFMEDIDNLAYFSVNDTDLLKESNVGSWRPQDVAVRTQVGLKQEQLNTRLTGRMKKSSQDALESVSIQADSIRDFSLETGDIEPRDSGKLSVSYLKQEQDRLRRYTLSAGMKRNAETDLFHGSSDVAGLFEYAYVDGDKHWNAQLLRSKVQGWSRTLSGDIRHADLYTTMVSARYLRHRRLGAERDWTVWYGGGAHGYLISGNSSSGSGVSRTLNGDARVTAQVGGRKKWTFNADQTSLTPVLNLALVGDLAQNNASEQRPYVDIGFQSNNALRLDHRFGDYWTASASMIAAAIYLPDIYVKQQRSLTVSLNNKNLLGRACRSDADGRCDWVLGGEIYGTLQKTDTTLQMDHLNEALAEEMKRSLGVRLVYTSDSGWKLGADLSYTHLDDRVNNAQIQNPVLSLTVSKAF